MKRYCWKITRREVKLYRHALLLQPSTERRRILSKRTLPWTKSKIIPPYTWWYSQCRKRKGKKILKDLVVKNATRTHKPVKQLQVGDLCYRRHFHGKKTLRIENLCEVIKVCNSGESYYIRDISTDRIYLRNCSWIEPSESSINEIHQAKNLKVKFDNTISHSLIEGKVHSTKRKVPTSCLRSKDSTIPPKRVHFNSTMMIAHCELISWRAANKWRRSLAMTLTPA